MPYDLLIKNGAIVDGSGAPAFRGDVPGRDGKIVEIGKVSGAASRVLDADGLVVAPGFIDNHCHYDAQVTWDPLCTSSCYHGATTVITGNCSLSLAPATPAARDPLLQMFASVEAIPIDALRKGIDWRWQTFGEYLRSLRGRLGVNLGAIVGHSALRYHVMGAESQERAATDREVREQQRLLQEELRDGALGVSLSRNTGHFDLRGRLVPAVVASEDELFALAGVLRESGAGIVQIAALDTEIESGLCSRLSMATGRPVIYGSIKQRAGDTTQWRRHLALVEQRGRQGARAYPLFSPRRFADRFTMRNVQEFRGVPTFHPITLAPDEEKLRAYRDPAVRRVLYEEVVERKRGVYKTGFVGHWDNIAVTKPALAKNEPLRGMDLEELAKRQGKNVLDAFLDLVVEEDLATEFEITLLNDDPDAVAALLKSPSVVVGLSDGGAHVVFDIGCGYTTAVLATYVREKAVLTLEEAVRKLTSHSAEVFGIADRGLLRTGYAADIVVFDQQTIAPEAPAMVSDLPGGAARLVQRARGIRCTIVNGQVLIENGRHTGALPGQVVRKRST